MLVPSGQFGTRLMGGKDAASPRYIHTYLSNITRDVFIDKDEPVLTYINMIFLLLNLIITFLLFLMILVQYRNRNLDSVPNIPCFNPTDIVKQRNKLNDVKKFSYYSLFKTLKALLN